MAQPLRERPFRLVWLGQAASRFGDGMFVVGLATLALSAAQGGAGYATLLACYGAGVAVALAGGTAVADKWPRGQIIVVADLVRCAAVTGLAVTAGSPQHGLACAYAAILGMGGGIFAPAYSAIIPDLVPESAVQRATGLNSGAAQLARIAGPALGSLLVLTVGARQALLIDALSFAVAAAATWAGCAGLRRRPAAGHGPQVQRFAGLREIARRPWLAAMQAQGLLQVLLVFGPMQVLTPVMLARQGRASEYGVLLGMQAGGSLLAVCLSARWAPSMPGLIVNLAFVFLAAEPLAVMSGSFAALAAALAVKGFALGLYSVLLPTALIRDVPKAALARVFAVGLLAEAVGRPVANIGVSVLLPAIGSRGLLDGCAAASLLTALAVIVIPGVSSFGPGPRRQAQGCVTTVRTTSTGG